MLFIRKSGKKNRVTVLLPDFLPLELYLEYYAAEVSLVSRKSIRGDSLDDESWLNYQKAKGEESFQAYMADLTDMQEHVLPYLQSFCSLEERAPERSVEPTTVSKSEMEAGKTIASVGNGFRILHFCNVSLPQVLLRIQFV